MENNPQQKLHYVTVTADGLEIMDRATGAHTVFSDLHHLRNLAFGIHRWITENICKARLFRDDRSLAQCQRHKSHCAQGIQHYGVLMTEDQRRIVGHVFWTDEYIKNPNKERGASDGADSKDDDSLPWRTD